MERDWVLGIVGVLVVVLLCTIIVLTNQWEPEEIPHSYYLDGIGILSDSYWDYYPSPDDPELEGALRDELEATPLTLVFEIEEVGFSIEVPYEFIPSPQRISRVEHNESTFEEWEHGRTYEYTIRFVCTTDNATIRSLSVFDE